MSKQSRTYEALEANADLNRKVAADFEPFAEMRVMRQVCAHNQHDYTQGTGFPVDALLFCRNCGDVIPFRLEADDA